MHKYEVTDPQGVYEPVIIEVPFKLLPWTDTGKLERTDWFFGIELIVVKTIGVEKMHGCAISSVDAQQVVEMIRAVVVREKND